VNTLHVFIITCTLVILGRSRKKSSLETHRHSVINTTSLPNKAHRNGFNIIMKVHNDIERGHTRCQNNDSESKLNTISLNEYLILIFNQSI
jgi:hypothetical protein